MEFIKKFNLINHWTKTIDVYFKFDYCSRFMITHADPFSNPDRIIICVSDRSNPYLIFFRGIFQNPDRALNFSNGFTFFVNDQMFGIDVLQVQDMLHFDKIAGIPLTGEAPPKIT